MTRRSACIAMMAVFAVLLACRPARAQFETPNRAFHNATNFPLLGRHANVACESCHLNGQYEGTPTTCYQCHWVRKKDDRYQTRLGAQCEQCHRETSWNAVRWDHTGMTGQPLGAAHNLLACEACHKNNTFAVAISTCITCHAKDYDATKSPAHAAAGFSRVCEPCHVLTDVTFRNQGGAGFNHASFFPLVGVHATLGCESCHKNNVYKGTARDCVGCHLTEFNKTTNPNHIAAGFSTACESCHRATDPLWTDAIPFNHNAVFALVGVHATISCAACHVNNVFKGTARDCVGCHLAEYNRSTNPNHVAAGFSTACESCHKATDAQWAGATPFNHNAVFALVGVHATVACQVCHVNNVFKGTARDCVGCHLTEYNRTTSPNHAAAGFSTACESCHRATDSRWTGITPFDHNAVFALVGVHATVACQVCHVNNVFKGTPRDCVGCHLQEYNKTTNPNHVAAGFSTTCDQCHRATDPDWFRPVFNHVWFPLRGVHNVACATCHTTSNNYIAFSCTAGCHARPPTDSKHVGIGGYVYADQACYACHPQG